MTGNLALGLSYFSGHGEWGSSILGSLPRGQFKLAKSSSLITGEAARNSPREVAQRAEGVAAEIYLGAEGECYG